MLGPCVLTTVIRARTDRWYSYQIVEARRSRLKSTSVAVPVNVQSRMASVVFKTANGRSTTIVGKQHQYCLPVILRRIAFRQQHEITTGSGSFRRPPFPVRPIGVVLGKMGAYRCCRSVVRQFVSVRSCFSSDTRCRTRIPAHRIGNGIIFAQLTGSGKVDQSAPSPPSPTRQPEIIPQRIQPQPQRRQPAARIVAVLARPGAGGAVGEADMDQDGGQALADGA